MITLAALLVAVVLGAALGVLGERLRLARARRSVPTVPAYVHGPPRARRLARDAASGVEHVLDDDHRTAAVARYVADCVVASYGQGASDLREQIVHGGPLPADVLDGMCSLAMSAIERDR